MRSENSITIKLIRKIPIQKYVVKLEIYTLVKFLASHLKILTDYR